MTSARGPARETPQDRIPIFRWGVQEAMVRELLGERWFPSGMWIPNTVQPTWELGKRWGLPRVIKGNLNINGQNAFLEGPPANKRWFVTNVWREATTGLSQIIVRPKDGSEDFMRLTTSVSDSQTFALAWPGFLIENDSDRFSGGEVGLQNSANAGDSSRGIRILVYESDM